MDQRSGLFDFGSDGRSVGVSVHKPRDSSNTQSSDYNSRKMINSAVRQEKFDTQNYCIRVLSDRRAILGIGSPTLDWSRKCFFRYFCVGIKEILAFAGMEARPEYFHS